MQLDKALYIISGGETRIYETPHGTKLSVTTPSGEDWHASGEEFEAAKQVMGEYEDVTAAVYEAGSEKEIADVLSDSDAEEPWKVIGAVENIPLTEDEARQLTD